MQELSHRNKVGSSDMVQPSSESHALWKGNTGTMPLHTMLRKTTADRFLSHCTRALPIDKILRDATRMEREKLSCHSHTGFRIFGKGRTPKPQAGWHVHGTHVFAIPVVTTSGAATAPGGSYYWPASSAAEDKNIPQQQYYENSNGGEDEQMPGQQYYPEAPEDSGSDAAEVNPQGANEDTQKTAGPGPYRVFFMPNIRASRVWWTQHPEYLAWLMNHRSHQDEPAAASSSYNPHADAHRSMLNSVDLMHNVLARWDHYGKVYRAIHAPHEYRAPPADEYDKAHGSAVARLVQWLVPQNKGQQQKQQEEKQEQPVMEDNQPSRASYAVSNSYYYCPKQQSYKVPSSYYYHHPKQQYTYSNTNSSYSSSSFAWTAWVAIALLLLFVVLGSAYNTSWYWPYVAYTQPREELWSILAFSLIVFVILFCMGWAVYVSLGSDSGLDNRYYYDDPYRTAAPRGTTLVVQSRQPRQL